MGRDVSSLSMVEILVRAGGVDSVAEPCLACKEPSLGPQDSSGITIRDAVYGCQFRERKML